jgi:hypothetical protein
MIIIRDNKAVSQQRAPKALRRDFGFGVASLGRKFVSLSIGASPATRVLGRMQQETLGAQGFRRKTGYLGLSELNAILGILGNNFGAIIWNLALD